MGDAKQLGSWAFADAVTLGETMTPYWEQQVSCQTLSIRQSVLRSSKVCSPYKSLFQLLVHRNFFLSEIPGPISTIFYGKMVYLVPIDLALVSKQSTMQLYFCSLGRDDAFQLMNICTLYAYLAFI